MTAFVPTASGRRFEGRSAQLMNDASIYAHDEDSAPDSVFAAGEFRHLVVGNRGRLLDARRTPITVVDVAPERGLFVVRIDAFEDAGARWEFRVRGDPPLPVRTHCDAGDRRGAR
jgi:hypothetical protein